MIITLNHFTTTESSRKLALRNTLLSAVAAVLVASCASAPPTLVHETVGPDLSAVNTERNGFLTVYSAREWATDGDSPSLLNYTNYRIEEADGSLFKEVPNGDQEPSRVILPEGTYTVVAQSDSSGKVSVPVAIEAGKTTVVHLEGEKDGKEGSAGIRDANLVRLPNGQPIGLRAQHAGLPKVQS